MALLPKVSSRVRGVSLREVDIGTGSLITRSFFWGTGGFSNGRLFLGIGRIISGSFFLDTGEKKNLKQEWLIGF